MAVTPVERFLERLRGAGLPDTGAWAAAAFTRCVELFPELSPAIGDFAAELAERFPTAEAQASLPELAIEDLFVAWATVRALPEALGVFEHEFLLPACSAAKSTDPAELVQQLRVRLLVPEGGRPPRLAQYTGRGPLLAWTRMAARRVSIDASRRAGTERRAVEELSHSSAPFDPELDYLKARYAGPFRDALERALRALSERDATLIQLAYLDDIPPSAMARMHGVSTRTVQRWIAEARASVLEHARAILSETLNVDPAEIDGLMRLARSQLQVTLERVLGRKGDG